MEPSDEKKFAPEPCVEALSSKTSSNTCPRAPSIKLASRKGKWSVHIAAGCKVLHTLVQMKRRSRAHIKETELGRRPGCEQICSRLETSPTKLQRLQLSPFFKLVASFPSTRVMLLSSFLSFFCSACSPPGLVAAFRKTSRLRHQAVDVPFSRQQFRATSCARLV